MHSSDIFISDPFSLNQSDIKPFKEFYCNYVSMSSEKNKKFANALRWLSQASIRKLKDDRFLDYVIALESLYVEGNEEVSYRISMRSAHFLGANKHERNRIFHLMRTAYKIRSVMVHDGKSLPKEVKIESVGTMSGDAFLNEIGVICFTTLKKIVNSKGNDFPTTSKAWDELILLGRT